MSRSPWWLVVALVAGSVVLFTACSGGGGSKKTATPAATTSSSAGGDASTTPGSGSPELTAVKDRFQQSTFKGTYDLSGSNTSSDVLANGTMVIYKSGPGRFRFDVTANENGQNTKITFIQKDNTSAFCLDSVGDLGAILGIDPNQGVCFKSDPNDPNSPIGGLSSTISDIAVNGDILEKTSRTIAGRAADCYRIQPSDGTSISTSCFGSDGVLLYTKTEGTDESEITATDISGTIQDSDFDLPYEERAFPTDTSGG